jgi:phospholipid transport system transporter-binding protein
MSAIRISVAAETGALGLSGALGIYEAETVRQAILEHLAARSELVLDLRAVEACDTAGAQILCAARRTAGQAGKPIRFLGVAPAITECWARLGLPQNLLMAPAANSI